MVDGGGGSLIGWGGGDVRHRPQCRPRKVWGHAPPEFFL